MGASTRHDALVHDFVMRAGNETRSAAELMVVLKSITTAAMLLAARVHGLPPHVAAGLVEAAIQRATERFADRMKESDR